MPTLQFTYVGISNHAFIIGAIENVLRALNAPYDHINNIFLIAQNRSITAPNRNHSNHANQLFGHLSQ